jgi:hypothetical protein
MAEARLDVLECIPVITTAIRSLFIGTVPIEK